MKIRDAQAIVEGWVRRVLGDEVLQNSRERSHRVLEEAAELAQAVGLSQADAHRLINYVYARPAGAPAQEIAGTFVTLFAVSASIGIDVELELEKELKRIHEPGVEARVRGRQAEKQALLSDTTGSVKIKGGLVLDVSSVPPGDEDQWLTCLLCEYPKINEFSGGHFGQPVEYSVVLRGTGQTRGVGLHAKCWARHGGPA